MVDSQIRSRGIRDRRVIEAMEKVPRHLFVDKPLQDQAYDDNPLPIGEGQTISQPYMVALMTEALAVKPEDKILEIGTGSGYQAAILAELNCRVYTAERIPQLAFRAQEILRQLNYHSVAVKVGDGTICWQEEAPFDGIIVTAGAPSVPQVLVEQLKIGGRLIIPVGDRFYQNLLRITRLSEDLNDVIREDLGGCRFVSLIGDYGWKK